MVRYQELKHQFEDATKARSKADEKFQSHVSEQIAEIKTSIRLEQEVSCKPLE